jgi:hypothetical protein
MFSFPSQEMIVFVVSDRFLPVIDFVIHGVVLFNKEKKNTKTSRFQLPIPQVAVKIHIY